MLRRRIKHAIRRFLLWHASPTDVIRSVKNYQPDDRNSGIVVSFANVHDTHYVLLILQYLGYEVDLSDMKYLSQDHIREEHFYNYPNVVLQLSEDGYKFMLTFKRATCRMRVNDFIHMIRKHFIPIGYGYHMAICEPNVMTTYSSYIFSMPWEQVKEIRNLIQ